jgi:hypothetical protein
LAESASSRSASPLEDLLQLELPVTPWSPANLEEGAFAVLMSKKELISNTDDPAFADIPTSSEREAIELNRSIVKEAIATLKKALVIHNYLLSRTSAMTATRKALVQYFTTRLNASVNSLARGAKDLLQMTEELAPSELQASSEAQWFTALIEDHVAATNKLVDHGEKLMEVPRWYLNDLYEQATITDSTENTAHD